MPVVKVLPDTLDGENRRFLQARLANPVFLNSVPKSGSHLLRNIMRMFVPVEQQYQAQFIQWPNLQQHLAAFAPARNYLSWGHLFFSDASAIELARVRKILLYRDPYDWVVARARFFMSENFQGNIDHIREGTLSVEDLFSLMIFGIHTKAPPMADIYNLNAVAWLGSATYIVRFEDLRRHANAVDTDEARAFFEELIVACGIALPDDWRGRVMVGADRKQSGTARENLSGMDLDLPDQLPASHRRLVDYAVPGLRDMLGYHD